MGNDYFVYILLGLVVYFIGEYLFYTYVKRRERDITVNRVCELIYQLKKIYVSDIPEAVIISDFLIYALKNPSFVSQNDIYTLKGKLKYYKYESIASTSKH